MATIDDIRGANNVGVKPTPAFSSGEGGVTAPSQGNLAMAESKSKTNETAAAKGATTFVPSKDALPPTQFKPDLPTEPDSKLVTPRRIGYAEMFERTAKRPESDEDIAKAEKKRKRDELFAAIGDGISGISNIYFASKGAPSMFDGKNGMSTKTKERWDKITKDRDAYRERYNARLMDLRSLDDVYNQRERAYNYQVARDAQADKKDAVLNYLKEQNLIAGNKRDNELTKAKIALLAAQTGATEAKGKSYAAKSSGGGSGKASSGGKSNSKVFSIPDGNGGYVNIDKSRLNDATISELYKQFGAPDEVVLERNYKGVATKSRPMTRNEKLDYIGKHIGENPNAAKHVKAAGVNAPKKQQTSAKSYSNTNQLFSKK